MQRDEQRIERLRDALRRAGLCAVVCARPANVLMLSGYWPVTGTAVAICTSDGEVLVLAPQDEAELANAGWADRVFTFQAGSLEDLRSAAAGVAPVLVKAISSLRLAGRVGIELGEAVTPAAYVALHTYGPSLDALLRGTELPITIEPADELLERLRSVKTLGEIRRIKRACQVAHEAFERGMDAVRQGMSELDVAAAFRPNLYARGIDADHDRADGFVYCMSGPNGYEAFAAYQRSRGRVLQRGDLALVHCNSYVDGFWTDITRTYTVGGTPDERQRRMYEAVFAARAAALGAIRSGVRAADVDRAARDVMTAHGFGAEFRHATGHGVGFAAINHNALPRIHPKSPDVLEAGMTFNVEPGIYIKGYGGMRHCDMIAVTRDGCEVLTPFQSDINAVAAPFA
jgi:Xaa-Pro aminopeptidase